MWPKTALSHLLRIRYPIIQAGMAGGPTTPELVAAVSNAGGLGTLGAGYLSPAVIQEGIQRIRRLTDRPFAVNLFIPTEFVMEADSMASMQNFLHSTSPFGMDDVQHQQDEQHLGQIIESFADQFAVILEERIPVLSFTFGSLSADEIAACKERGICMIGTATTVHEAILLEASGVDAVVAQGSEAGGHRGTFLHDYMHALVGTIALVPQIADCVHIPVIASGGIMDARGIVASLALGASGVQLGTAFLVSRESGAHRAYKTQVMQCKEDQTVITTAFSGKAARGIENVFIRQMQQYAGRIPPYPVQNALTRPLRTQARIASNSNYMSLWAGQAASLAQDLPAEEIVAQLVRGVEQSIQQLKGDNP